MVVVNFDPLQSAHQILYPEDVLKRPSGEDRPKMTARATLICRPNSHPFQERNLLLDQPVKVGRSVARARHAPNNAIFDCKVLSRNHALLWYENGKFYLQDTKSSNGTFVNNQRLSKGSEESLPREVCSGDIVQFGVDVMENSRKVTHGCIVATLKLYLPDGKEAKASPSTSVVGGSLGSMPAQDLYQLNQYLQDAAQREQMLENKLATLQRLISSTKDASDSGWKALIDEDRLLTRLEILEGQLQAYSKNFPEDKLREEVKKLQEEKNLYQDTAKESLMKVLQEKLEAVRKMQDASRSLTNTEEECANLKEVYNKTTQELQELAEKYSKQTEGIEELNRKLQETEEKHKEGYEKLEQEKKEMDNRLEEKLEAEATYIAKIESLQAEVDFTKEQLNKLRSKVENVINGEINGKTLEKLKETDSTGIQTDTTVILKRIEPELEEDVKVSLKESHDEVEALKNKLRKSEEELEEYRAKVEQLGAQLLECESDSKEDSDMVQQLEEQVTSLKAELQKVTYRCPKCNNGLQSNGAPSGVLGHIREQETNQTNTLKAEISRLQELLEEARDRRKLAETEALEYRNEIDDAKACKEKAMQEVANIKEQLQAAQVLMREKSEYVTLLQEQVVKLETSARDVKQQILTLKDRLLEEQQKTKAKKEEADSLRKQLKEAEQTITQTLFESEKLRTQLKTAEMDSKKEESLVESPAATVDTDSSASQEELKRLQGDYDKLKSTFNTLESDLKRAKEEKIKLQEDYKHLLVAHANAESLKLRLEQGEESGWVREMEKSHSEAQQAQRQLADVQEELMLLKENYMSCSEEKCRVQRDLDEIKGEYKLLSYQSKTATACSFIPLMVLFIGFLTAFYPTMSLITGTSEPFPP